MNDELSIVADSIRTLRETTGMTQEQLAEKAEISVSHLSKIEAHMRTVGMKTYIKLLNAMDVPIKEHFLYISLNRQENLLEKRVWRVFQDCDEKEIALLICSVEGIKKGLKEYQQR